MPTANVTTQHDQGIRWNSIEWRQQHRIVNNLRQRIYRASEAGDVKRVCSLQKLMLKSTANKLVAIRRVTQQNQGKRTPGVDKVVIKTAKERELLYHELATLSSGKPTPVKRVYIPKKAGKRPLGLPTIVDRCWQAIVKNALEPYWEARFESTSYGFRPGRSAHDAIEKIFAIANSRGTRKWVLDADIKGAFDNISHSFLLGQLKGFPGNRWIKGWLVAGFVEEKQWHPTLMGTPQGGIISPLLANIVFHGMEEAVGVRYDNRGILRRGCCAIVRYADDFVVFCKTREGCEVARLKLQHWLAERGLTLSETKTQIRHMTQGFDFLGFHIRHYPVKNRKQPYIFLAKPSKSSIQHFRQQVKQAWKQAQSWPTQQVVSFLNPQIRGWSYYFRIGAAKDTFASLDRWMWIKQKRFVARRHPHKSWQWRCARYWGQIPQRKDNWVFMDKNTNQHLLKIAWTPSKRHTLVKGNASPDNPVLRDYWCERQSKKVRTLSASKIRIEVWSRQRGRCLQCGEPLDNEETVRYYRREIDGGIEASYLVHDACHKQITGEKKKPLKLANCLSRMRGNSHVRF